MSRHLCVGAFALAIAFTLSLALSCDPPSASPPIDEGASEGEGEQGEGEGEGEGEGDGEGEGEGEIQEEDVAVIVSHTLPSALACNESVLVDVIVRNDGTATWTDEFRLGAVDDSDPLNGAGRIYLDQGATVAPGDAHTFTFALTAPSSEGTFTTDWRMVHEAVRWFGETVTQEVAVTCAARAGAVSLNGRSLRDAGGDFHALGATMFYALWAYEFDRERLERNLAFLSQHGVHYVRVLGVVGNANDPDDYWHDRAADWRWPDYDDAIAGLTDLAYDTYGMRIEWTLMGGSYDDGDRFDLIDRFVAMGNARPEKVLMFEIGNESWQNGFAGDEGRDELRALTAYMNDRTDILVATTAPYSAECDVFDDMYDGDLADIATVHFDRSKGGVEGGWEPARQPWDIRECTDMVVSNNEPIGPGSSVNTEDDPVVLAGSVLTTFIAGLPMHVFHSRAGVRGDVDFSEMAGASTVGVASALLPDDVASWDRREPFEEEHPFVVYRGRNNGELRANEVWPDDADDSSSGVVRAYAAVNGAEFVMVALGIRGSVEMDARRAITFTVRDVLSGAAVQSGTLAAGERLHLEGAAAFLIEGAQQ